MPPPEETQEQGPGVIKPENTVADIPISSKQTAPPPNGHEWGKTVLTDLFEKWFSPEIERRRAAGLIGEDFVLLIAQVLFPEDGPNKVRLNHEVRGLMMVEAQRAADKDEQVLLTDLAGVQKFELNEDELNCGHFTIIRLGAGNDWVVTFNALAGRKKAANLVMLASGFLSTARYSRENLLSGPCIDTLFSCCELLAKAELILHRSSAAKAKKHGSVGSAINKHAQLSRAHSQFISVFNRLGNIRSAARYEGTTAPHDLPTDSEINAIESYLAYLKNSSSSQIDDNAVLPGIS